MGFHAIPGDSFPSQPCICEAPWLHKRSIGQTRPRFSSSYGISSIFGLEVSDLWPKKNARWTRQWSFSPSSACVPGRMLASLTFLDVVKEVASGVLLAFVINVLINKLCTRDRRTSEADRTPWPSWTGPRAGLLLLRPSLCHPHSSIF